MKKLNVLLIVAMLAAALLAANPPGKLVRLMSSMALATPSICAWLAAIRVRSII